MKYLLLLILIGISYQTFSQSCKIVYRRSIEGAYVLDFYNYRECDGIAYIKGSLEHEELVVKPTTNIPQTLALYRNPQKGPFSVKMVVGCRESYYEITYFFQLESDSYIMQESIHRCIHKQKRKRK